MMRNAKERKVGVGANLYGIPINDILTPDELEEIRVDAVKTSKERRRKRAEKNSKNNKNSNWFKADKIKLNKNILYVIAIAVVALIIILILKNPVLSRIAPKMYFRGAMDKTFSRIAEESEGSVERLLGFNPANKKEFTVSLDGIVESDTSGKLNNVSANSVFAYSEKDNNVSSLSDFYENGDKIWSVAFYVNEEEIGVGLPEILGEYWVAPTEKFGKTWNESGLRKAVYAKEISDKSDISFVEYSDDEPFLTKESQKKEAKLRNKLYSSSKGKYIGKEKITINGKTKKGRHLLLTLSNEAAEDYLVSLTDIIYNDKVARNRYSYMGTYGEFVDKLTLLASYLKDDVDFKSVTADAVEYDGSIVSLKLNGVYDMNGVESTVNLKLVLSDSESATDDLYVALTFSGVINHQTELKTGGNHSAKGKVYEDITTVKTVSEKGEVVIDSNIVLDYKNEIVNGNISIKESTNTKVLSYSGKCNKKGNLNFQLDTVSLLSLGDENRTVSGKMNIKAEPKMTMDKLSSLGKKNILELNKNEVGIYLAQLQENAKIKDFFQFLDRMFNKVQ